MQNNTLEAKEGNYCAHRLGFRQIKGLREEDMQLLVAGRTVPYTNINQLRLIGLPYAALEKLADADAFQSIGIDRREALWEVTSNDNPVGLFAGFVPEHEQVELPALSLSENVVYDYAAIALSLKAHPVSFVRNRLQQLQATLTGSLGQMHNGDAVRVACLVLVRQRPGTAGGVCFMTIEDEAGIANCVIWPALFDEFRKPILQSRLIMVEGHLQIEGLVIHVIAHRLYNLTTLLGDLTAANKDDIPVNTLARADEKSIPPGQNKKRQVRERLVQAEIIPSAETLNDG